MEKLLLLLLFILAFQQTHAQQSLDSLRMVLPSGHTEPIWDITFSNDKKRMITSSEDGTARIYEMASGKELQVLKDTRPNAVIETATFSPDGTLALTTHFPSGFVTMWEVATGRQIKQLKAFARNAQFSQNGKLILTSGRHSIKLWDVNSGREIKDLTTSVQKGSQQRLDFNVAIFSPDGRFIVGYRDYGWEQMVGSDRWKQSINSNIRIWDGASGMMLRDLRGHSNVINDIRFSPDSKYLISSSNDGIAKIWEISTGTLFRNLKDNDFQIYKAGFALEGSVVITICTDRKLRMLDVSSGKVLYIEEDFFGHQFQISEDGRYFIASTNGISSYYCDLLLIHISGIYEVPYKILCFAPDSKNLILENGNSIRLIDFSYGSLREFGFKNIGDFDTELTKITFPKPNKIAISLHDAGTFVFDENQTGYYQAFIDTNWLHGYSSLSNTRNFSSDGSMVILPCKDNTARIHNVDDGKLLQTLVGHKELIHTAVFSSDLQMVLTTSDDGLAIVWDVNSGQKRLVLDHRISTGDSLTIVIAGSFSPDGRSVITVTFKDWSSYVLENKGAEYHFWSLDLEREIQRIIPEPDFDYVSKIDDFGLSGKIFFRDTNRVLKLYQVSSDSEKGLVEQTLPFKEDVKKLDRQYSRFIFSLSQNFLAVKRKMKSSYDVLDIRTMRTFSLPWKKKWHLEKYPFYAVFSPDFKLFLSQSKIWDTKSGKKIQALDSFNTASGLIHQAFCPDGSHVLWVTDDHKIVLWDVATGNPIYERIQLLNNNWLVKLPNSPYYMCSKDASKMLHYVTPSLKVIGFEQLDPVYNRPDIVLDSIGRYFGNEDRGMIDEYRKSWEKRIDRLGLDKEKLGKGEIAVPSAEILDADDISYENNNGELEIKVSANDAKYPLRRFNVYVNEVPLYGSAGISIAHLNKQVWDTTISVPLSVGENKIQVSVMNELGLENFKYPTYVNYSPQEQLKAKTYYIGIGVNEFVQSAHNLKYCVKDVRDLAKSFATENSNTDTLLFTDQQVTRENILALKTMLLQTSVNDKVIISCSSHGLLDDSLNFYLAMHDVDFNNPKARGLKYEELESLLDSIPARQKLLLLDACNSGENDKTELLKKEVARLDEKTATNEQIANIGRIKGVVVELEEENTNNFKKINELFVNVRNNTGSVIISAAGGQESALEAISVGGKTIENGAFTYSILECLKQNEGKELKVNALKQYAEKRVEEITNGKQKPTSRQETMEIDWEVR